MSIAATAAAQLSPRSQARAQSQLARANSVTGQKGIGSTPVAKAATLFLAHSLLEKRDLYKLFVLVRQNRISVPMLNEALLRAAKRSDLIRQLTAQVPETPSTIAHELARSGSLAHLQWLANQAPELLYARESKSEMNLLHVCALMRHDSNSPELVRLLWSSADPKLLVQLDAAGYTPVHYLAMCDRREAARVAAERAGRVPPARSGDTVEQLLIANLERTVGVLQSENRRQEINIQAAEGTSLMLTEMHKALDKAINDRDAELARLREQLAQAGTECDRLRDAHAELVARGVKSDSVIEELRGELTSANDKAQRAHSAFHEAVEKMRESQLTARALAEERERMRSDLRAAEAALRLAQQTIGVNTQELELAVEAARAQAKASEEALYAHQDAHSYLENEYNEAKQELDSLRHDLALTQENYTNAQNEAYELRAEMEALQSELSERGEQLAQLRKERDGMRATRAEKSARRGAALSESDSDTERQSLAQMQQLLDEREQQISQLQQRLTSSLREPIAPLQLPLPPPPPPPSSNGASETDTIVRRNHRLNREFYSRLFGAIARGDGASVRNYLALGVSANTRNLVGDGQTLLQIAVLSARETHGAAALMNAKDHKALIERLEDTIRVIIEAGGDWEALDEFLDRNGGDRMPPRIEKLLRARDDIAPFCKALIDRRDEEAALAALDGVEDLMRVPTKYAAERHTYLHLAAAAGFAKLIERMVLAGLRIDANRRDAKDRAPLHLALQKCPANKRRMVAEALLAAGASPTLPCTYAKLIAETRRRLEKRSGAAAGQSNGAGGGGGAGGNEAIRYGMPIAQAEALGSADLVECMRNRRHLRLSIEPSDEKEFGAPLLQDYVIMCVSLHVQVHQLLHTNAISAKSSLHKMFLRYGSVFQCFNPHFGGFAGYAGAVLDQLYRDAGAVDRHSAPAGTLERMLDADQVVLTTLLSTGGNTPVANLIKSACTLLFRCTEAIRMRWFEVAAMIELPAQELHERAAAAALRHFVLENRVAEIDFMLNRTDGLFGALDVNSIVDLKRRYTPIELATWRGCADTLEYFLERQRQRIDAADAAKGTLVQIARDARQSISIVLIDHFKFRAHLSRERHPNAPHYDMTTIEGGNTVVGECARQHRLDLLRFCIDRVAFQLEKPNTNGETPLRIIETMLAVQQISELATQQWNDCADLIRRRIAGDRSDDNDDGEQSTGSTSVSATPTPRLAGEREWHTIDMRAVQRAALEAASEANGVTAAAAVASPRSHRSSHRSHRKKGGSKAVEKES